MAPIVSHDSRSPQYERNRWFKPLVEGLLERAGLLRYACWMKAGSI